MAVDSQRLEFIRQHCPVVVFHESEQFFPCSIQHLLKDSTLLQRSRSRTDNEFHVGDPSVDELAEYTSTEELDHFVEISPSQLAGHAPVDGVVNAPIYVALVEIEQAFVDIYYIFLYACQGSQTFRCTPPIAKHFNCIAHEYGRHQGDIEHFIVRTDASFSTVLSVAYEAHGEQAWYFPGNLSSRTPARLHSLHKVVKAALMQSVMCRGVCCARWTSPCVCIATQSCQLFHRAAS